MIQKIIHLALQMAYLPQILIAETDFSLYEEY